MWRDDYEPEVWETEDDLEFDRVPDDFDELMESGEMDYWYAEYCRKGDYY